MKREDIYQAIDNERARQDAKFPGQWSGFAADFEITPSSSAILERRSIRRRALLECTAILGEEVGEVAKAVLERDDQGLECELIQVAAVCVAWLEARA